MPIKDWKAKGQAKILVIGHDARLQNSDTIAEYCLFIDYYFRDVPRSGSEKKKYNLAKNTIEQILYLTAGKYCAEDIFITNLCNEELPHAPTGKTVLIPYENAKEGLEHILGILQNNRIEYVFSTSLQVNYWLQKLGFYNSEEDFLEASKPRFKGVCNDPPYYEPQRSKSFQKICGKVYEPQNCGYKVIPILHPKNYPLKGNFTCYQGSYGKIRNYFLNIQWT